MRQDPRTGWYELAKPPHQFLMRKWYEPFGVKPEDIITQWYDEETRELHYSTAYLEETVVTTTPPPWMGKSRKVR